MGAGKIRAKKIRKNENVLDFSSPEFFPPPLTAPGSPRMACEQVMLKNSNGILDNWDKDAVYKWLLKTDSFGFILPLAQYQLHPSSPAFDDEINVPKVIVYH